MYTIVLALHVFVSFLLIIAVLLQNSKGSDLGAALGGGSGDMFGPKAPSTIMNKITTVIAAAFLVLSLVLAMMSGLGDNSVMKKSVVSESAAPISEPKNDAVNSKTQVDPLAIKGSENSDNKLVPESK